MVDPSIPPAADVTCLLSAILGNRMMSERIGASVDRCLGKPCERIWLDGASFREHPAPPLMRYFSALEVEIVAHRLVEGRRFAGTLIVNGFALAQAVRPASSCRMIVATDTTPRLVTEMVSSEANVPRRGLGRLYDAHFRALASRVDQWLPISATCRDSLVAHYNVAAGRCHVTRIPQPDADREPRSRPGAPYKLLFVGNDFGRKGGGILLEAFQRRLLPDCELTVVSNDPGLPAEPPERVTIVRGISRADAVVPHYRSADLLVLPTRADSYPNVLSEALARGLPFVATAIGAIGELAEESQAGILLPPSPTAEVVARAVRAALADGPQYLARSRAAVSFAQRYLSLDAFDATIRKALMSSDGRD